MTYLYGILLFLIGFLIGACIIWYIRQIDIYISQSSRNQLKAEFGDLSKQALDQNLDTF